MPRPRYLEASVREDLAQRMVFIGGPRQVGKTTVAKGLLPAFPAGVYLDWDNEKDRKAIRAALWPGGEALVVLDELHKWRHWKRWIKGEFDKHGDGVRFLVTGSARLDVYRRGGDSLQGRYHHYRLHPFSVAELSEKRSTGIPEPGREIEPPREAESGILPALLARGGFPVPFLAASERARRRWHKYRLDRFFRGDVRDLESVRDLSTIQVLADLLPERVGSPLSLNSLREDLDASHGSVSHWVDVLEHLYHTYRLRPFAPKRSRSLRKMPKAYLWDWSEVPAPGPRFENLVASHLLKFVHWLEDVDGWRAELWYLRDRAGREVDFLVTVDRKPWFAVEAKVSAAEIDPSLRYFKDAFRIPFAYQVVLEGERDYVQDGIRCLSAARFLAALV